MKRIMNEDSSPRTPLGVASPPPPPKHSLVSGHKPLMFPTRVMFVHFHLLVAGVARRRAGDKALNMFNMHIVTRKL